MAEPLWLDDDDVLLLNGDPPGVDDYILLNIVAESPAVTGYGSNLTITELLDLTVGQRVERFRFDLVSLMGEVIGTIDPSRDSAPVIENNINRTIKRTMTNFVLNASEQVHISTLSDRIRPVYVAQTGDEFPLGVFLFGDASRPRRSWGLELEANLMDQGFILDQPIGRIVGYSEGTNAVQAAVNLAAQVMSVEQLVTPSGAKIGAPIAWPSDATRIRVMNDLLDIAGYRSPYFDNYGRLVLEPAGGSLDALDPDVTYNAGGRIIADSIVESDDQLSAPNRYVVVDTSNTDSPIVGQYDLPADAPHSIANRGFPIVDLQFVQGLGSQDAANAVAFANASKASSSYRWVSYASAFDPRHDTFDIVRFLGTNYREQRWSMTLAAGAPMYHDLRRQY